MLADAQAALDGQHAKLPLGHIVRLFARGDAGAAVALFAPQEPDGTDGVGEAAAVASTDEADAPDDEDIAVGDAPSMVPDAGEQADLELAPELGVADTLAALIDGLGDAPAEDGDEAI